MRAFKKYNYLSPDISETDKRFALQCLHVLYGPKMLKQYRVWSVAESLHMINERAASGWPENCLKQDLTRADLAVIDAYCEHPFDRIPLWKVCAKPSDVRKVGKDPRIFVLSPYAFTVLCGQYMNDLNKHLYEQPLDTPSTIGLDVIRDYHRFLYPCVNNDNCPADSTDYDCTVPQWALYNNAEFRKFYMPKESHRYIDYIYHHTVYSYCLLPNGMIYMKVQGVPSGSVNTSTDNTFAMTQMLCVSLRRALKREFRDTLSPVEFCHLFNLWVNGDDNNTTLIERYRYMFKEQFLVDTNLFCQLMRELGLKFRLDGSEKWRPCTEVNFLSVLPTQYRGRWVPIPADRNRFYTKLVWGENMSLGETLTKIVQDKYRAIFDDTIVDTLEKLIEDILIENPWYRTNKQCVDALRLNYPRDIVRRHVLGYH